MNRNERHEEEDAIVAGISVLIKQHLRLQAMQEYCPVADPDTMDAEIADAKKRVAELRRIRVEFEDIITGVLK